MHEGTPIIIKKKKSHGGHAHHGGSWKVAYADFVTAMMAFFMVMWIMGLSQETRSIIAGYFNDPLGFMKNEPRSKNIMPLKGMQPPKPGQTKGDGANPLESEDKERKLQAQIKKAIEGHPDLSELLKNIEMTLTDEGLRIEFMEARDAAFFESGSAVIRPAAMKLIREIGPIFAKSGRSMVIEGHTDSVPYPSSHYDNWNLSWDRANAFRKALLATGVSIKQIRGVHPLADTKLRRPDAPTDFANRRVTLLLPYDPAHGKENVLPKDAFEKQTATEFGRPLNIAPPLPDVKVEKRRPDAMF